MQDHAVLIIGGGPTGLTLAAELALAGVDVAIAEHRPNQDLAGSRAGGLHARTLEHFEQRGIAQRFLAEGTTMPSVGFAWFPLDISDFPSRHNCCLALWQNHIERLLAEWVSELSVPIYREHTFTELTQDEDGVTALFSNGASSRASYLVGCDGGRSMVRKSAGIDFPGEDPSISNLIAEVEVTEPPTLGLRRDDLGIHAMGMMEDGVRVRVMVTEQTQDRREEPTLEDVKQTLIAVYGTDFGAHSPTWVSRFTDMARQASTYREGRVLLAGDAAHIHYPSGGQGLNIGVQDAFNLGWKLASVVKQRCEPALLDTYHAERHPVAAAVLRDTLAQVALLRTDRRTDALREVTGKLLGMKGPRQEIAGRLSGLTTRYAPDEEDAAPLVGARIPDLELTRGEDTVQLYSLMHGAKPLFLTSGDAPADLEGWADRVTIEQVTFPETWRIPVTGEVASPRAVLVRPDGYIAWIDDGSGGTDIKHCLKFWFGEPASV